MNKFKLWFARKLFKGDIYIGEGAVIRSKSFVNFTCNDLQIDGQIINSNPKGIYFSGVKK